MKHTNIFFRWICLTMLLCSVNAVYGQTSLTADKVSLTTGEYILDDHLTISQTITIPENNTVTIDLNGKVLQGNLPKGGYVLNVQGTLTIKDSPETKGDIKGSIDEKGLFVWDGTGPVSVQGGTICNVPYENMNTQGIKVSGKCTVEYANIVGCYTSGNGGAVYMENEGQFIMKGGEISYNYAGSSGGGIYGHFAELRNSAFKYNRSEKQGGAIFVNQLNDKDATTLIGNLVIDNCTIKYNFTGVYGGGLYSQVKTKLTNSTISNNWAMTDELEGDQGQGRGGGLCFVGNGVKEIEDAQARKTLVAVEPIIDFTMENTTVSYNTAMFYGGGCQIHDGAKLILNSGSIEHNSVILHGAGGLHFTNATTFDFNGGSISNNHAEYVGGAIHSSYSCILNMDGGVITGNTVNGRGGGVHVNTGGDLKLNGTSITENKASIGKNYRIAKVDRIKNDDGTYVYSYTREENETERAFTGYGGGVFLDCCTGTMNMGNGGELSRNHAAAGGGGIALAMINMPENNKIVHIRVANFTLNSGHIEDNTTDGDGAGVYIMENKSKEDFDTKLKEEKELGKVTTYQTLYDNYYNGFLTQEIFYKTPEAFIYGGSMTKNIAGGNGGALFVFGNVTMTDGSITNNEANNGGGICITDGKVKITKGEISNNTANSYGGGLYVTNVASNDITLSGEGVFKNNTALKAGGGMAVGGPVTFAFSGTLEYNTAPNGGGIYLLPKTEGGERGAILNFNGGFIRNNTAVVDQTIKLDGQTAWHKNESQVAGVGGGVFLDDYTTLSFQLEENALGFYGNRASNAADDIFANGNGTKVELPDVSEMELSDFSVPAENLFWAEDYYSRYENGSYEEDLKYKSLLDSPPTFTEPDHNLRYQFALKNLKRAHIVEIPKGTFENRYVCLALGWEIFYVNIIKEGLKEGESAMFHIYQATDENSIGETPYITTVLTGVDNNGSMVYRTVTLPTGYWGVKENAWSYTYDAASTEPVIRQITMDDDIAKEEGFKFKNTPKEYKKNLLHHEAKAKNIMGKEQ